MVHAVATAGSMNRGPFLPCRRRGLILCYNRMFHFELFNVYLVCGYRLFFHVGVLMRCNAIAAV